MVPAWKHMTADQRIEQILGGVDIGMTFAQIAQNCRTERRAVAKFAERKGIKTGRRGFLSKKGQARAIVGVMRSQRHTEEYIQETLELNGYSL